MKPEAKGGETGYAVNKIQWFFEDVQMPRIVSDDLGELAQEMVAEMSKRGWDPETVDWDAVEKGLRQFLAAQAGLIVQTLKNQIADS